MEKWLTLIGRICYSAIFIMSGLHHLMSPDGMAQYASSMGVPAPKLMVILTGLMILGGGLSILLGWLTKLGALSIIVFLVIVTPWMHRPLSDQMQMIMFMKNLGLLGGALFLAAFGPGELSIDGRKSNGQM